MSSLKPIVLWRRIASVESDEACTTILKYSLPPTPSPGRYVDAAGSEDSVTRGGYVPSLKALCIKKLLEYPEQVHTLGVARVHYDVPKSSSDYDIIRDLIPGFSHSNPNPAILETVDPRLWCLIIQILSSVPDVLRVYTIPLSDEHVPLLQQIPQTSHFAMVTIVDLGSCPHLDDENIQRLGELNTLGALDISGTSVSTLGIFRLSKSLLKASETRGRGGPWDLRILDLTECRVDGEVMRYLKDFPLLSVVDLSYNLKVEISSVSQSGFRFGNNNMLYSPSPLGQRLQVLSSLCTPPQAMFANPDPFFLCIHRLYHKASDTPQLVAPVRSDRPSVSAVDHPGNFVIFTDQPAGPPRSVTNNNPPRAQRAQGARRSVTAPRASSTTASLYIERERLAATEEAQIEASRRAVAAFYAPLPPPPTHPPNGSTNDNTFPFGSNYRPSGMRRGKQLRLFRTPPSWSTPSVNQNPSDKQKTATSAKRPKIDDVDGLQGSAARESQKGKAARWALQQMINLRTHSGFGRGRSLVHKPMQLSENPFLRKTTSTPSLKMKLVPPDPGLGLKSPSRKVNKQTPHSKHDPEMEDCKTDSESSDQFEPSTSKSTIPVPSPATGKPLRPISKISVPSLPPSLIPKSPHASKQNAGPTLDRRRSTGTVAAAQTQLSFKRTGGAGSVKSEEGKSGDTVAVVSATKKLGPSKEAPFEDARHVKKRKSTGGFDWSNWAGGGCHSGK
ncbi:hypothetical protein BXZ70DRAFT_966030 [Cristinia sonorae]|uniref:Uncharacterized protein n=1 Tax=Cristinia sonorae TaxID=1940300 RepID=A0A8K0UXP6_9AGAR|nr:hypothetical protein BXZ70DRAFT_966030 [Cristinia sonorae]